MSLFNPNNVDPDQMPRSAASDLGLHCLSMSLLWDARCKWVKRNNSDVKTQMHPFSLDAALKA